MIPPKNPPSKVPPSWWNIEGHIGIRLGNPWVMHAGLRIEAWLDRICEQPQIIV